MIFIGNSFDYNNSGVGWSLISRINDTINYGQEVISNLFSRVFPVEEQVEIPTRSLQESLNAVRLDSDLQNFKKDWTWVVSTDTRLSQSRKVDAEYHKLMNTHSNSLINIQYPHFFADLGLNAGISSLWMPGVAMVAAHLAEKKGLQDLFVCASRLALVNKVEEVLKSPNSERCAIVVGANGSSDKPLHKFTFCIEKNDDGVKIMLLDSMGMDYYSASSLTSVLDVCKNNDISFEVFFSGEKREFAGYGCPVFALQDAVSFLQQEDFFQVIDFECIVYYDGLGVKKVKTLPPAFMIGIQSNKLLENYKERENGSLFTVPLPGRNKTLGQYIERNKGIDAGKQQNHYITRKLFQYKQFIVGALRELNDQEIRTLVYSRLLT